MGSRKLSIMSCRDVSLLQFRRPATVETWLYDDDDDDDDDDNDDDDDTQPIVNPSGSKLPGSFKNTCANESTSKAVCAVAGAPASGLTLRPAVYHSARLFACACMWRQCVSRAGSYQAGRFAAVATRRGKKKNIVNMATTVLCYGNDSGSGW